MIDRGLRLAGRGVGMGAAALAATLQVSGLVVGSSRRRDPDIGRLGPLPFDEARHLPAPDGGHLFTTAHGHGAPFLFVHGFAMTSRVWTKQFRDLPDVGVRPLAFDHRGHGASTALIAGSAIADLADDVRGVVEGLDLRDAVLVGHSMGGMALLAFAVRYPEVVAARVRGLVLVSAAARFDISRVPFLPGAVTPFTSGFLHSGVWSRADWSTLCARLLFGRDPVASQVELVRVLLAASSEETVIGCAQAMAGFDVTSELAKVAVPTLVVGGTADLLTTPREARQLARGLPDARLELVAGGGHMLMLERARRLQELLVDFGRRVGVVPAGLAA